MDVSIDHQTSTQNPVVLVAKRFGEKDKHSLNGANLEVTKEMSEKHKEAAKTITVTCLAAKTTEDSLWNYFENERRSGGGAVESVTIQHDTGTAFVTFEDADGKSLCTLLRGLSYPGRTRKQEKEQKKHCVLLKYLKLQLYEHGRGRISKLHRLCTLKCFHRFMHFNHLNVLIF